MLEHDKDLKKVKKLIKSGEFFGWYSIENSIQKAMDVLAQHHFGTDEFLTVENKTKLMVKNKDVPKYIISFLKK